MYDARRKQTLRRQLEREIRHFEQRLVATADPRTPRQKGAHTQARNCLNVARRKLRALEADRPLHEWWRLDVNGSDASGDDASGG